MLQFKVAGRPISEHPLKVHNLYPAPFQRSMASAYRPLATSPRPALQPPSLGQSFSPSGTGIAGSLMFLASGIGGFYVADIFGSPASGVVKGLSVIAAGWGAYSLVSAFTGGQAGKKAASETPPTKAMSPQAFALVSGRIIEPINKTLPKIEAEFFSLKGPYFTIKVVWKNDSKEVANFKYNVLGYSVAEGAIDKEGSPGYLRKIAFNDEITDLQPGQQTGAILVEIPITKPDAPLISEFYGKPKYFKMYLQLQKIGENQDIPVGDLLEFGPFSFDL